MNIPLLVVIRHGQTSFNVEKRFQGHLPVPLTEIGKMQAERSGNLLANLLSGLLGAGSRVKSCLTSDLLRAVETSGILAKTVRERLSLDLEFEPMPVLREYHDGDLEGLTLAEFEARAPGVFQAYLDSYDADPYGSRFPGQVSESRNMVSARLEKLVNGLQPGAAAPLFIKGGASSELSRNPFFSPVSHFAIPGADVHVWCTHGGVIENLFELLNAERRDEARYIRNGDFLVFAPLVNYRDLELTSSPRKLAPLPGTVFPSAHSREFGCYVGWKLIRHYQVGK